MGVLSAAAWLPWLLVGLPAGAWVDRLDPRRVMIAADLAAALTTASVPVAWALHALTLTHLAVAALLTGTCSVFFRTAYGSVVPRVVRPEDLDAANGRLYGTESAMQVAGPGLGGLLVQLVGGAFALLADTLSFLVSAVCLWRIPTRALRVVERPPARSLRRDVAEGVRVVARDPHLRFFTLQGAASNFALTGYGALLVLHLVRDLDVGPGAVGAVMAVGSVGGLLGAVVANRLSARLGGARAMRWLQVLGGPTALLVGAGSPGAGIALVALGTILVGTGVVGANVIRSAFRQRWVPPHLLGRTLSASSVLNFGTMPFAGLAAGWLGAHLGIRETILLMAGVHAVASLWVLVGPYGRGRDLPAGQMPPEDAAQDSGRWSSGSTATARKTTVT
jgi:MFS family permease